MTKYVLISSLDSVLIIIFLFESANTCFLLISVKFDAVLRKIIFLKYPSWWPRWRTCCETTVAIATVLIILDCCYGKQLTSLKLLACQTLIFYAQPFEKSIDGAKLLSTPWVNKPLHGFSRHLGCGAVAAIITANVWDIVQLSTLIAPQYTSQCNGLFVTVNSLVVQGLR